MVELAPEQKEGYLTLLEELTKYQKEKGSKFWAQLCSFYVFSEPVTPEELFKQMKYAARGEQDELKELFARLAFYEFEKYYNFFELENNK